ncbi:MAG: hypothetical protein AMS27_04425 [Bacteroides sp. SM23_62_1]|nr:MAG: hypothetical protein AMS27_04425 [Bacteroides sp. SM23_62_1]
MNQQTIHEKYPARIIAITNLLSVLIYIAGAYIIYQLGLIWALIYIGYLLFLEIRLLSTGCPDCYYYGKLCAFGKGRLSSLFFKKGDPERFTCRTFTWKDLIPDFLVALIPVIIGLVILILDFSWLILLLMILLFFLSTTGNGIIRGQYACKFCKQAEIGCPALELFSRKKQP